MSDQKIVMYDSDEAAKPTTVDGWISRDRYFFRDEHAARYQGCTHRLCNRCGEPTEKYWTSCNRCRAQTEAARYLAMPTAPWDGKSMLYSETREEYFVDPCSAESSLDWGETLADLRIVICKPVYASKLSEDYFADDLPENGELPGHIAEAIKAFNDAIDGTILSWEPGNTRLEVE